MSWVKKIFEVVVLILLALITLLFSILIYVKHLWPNANYEQIRVTIDGLTLNVIRDNIYPMDYVWGCLFFVIAFPLYYFYLNIWKRLVVAVILSLAVAYFSGFIDYNIYSKTTSRLYEERYVHPKDIEVKFEDNKRNLIVIYLESFEHYFQNAEYYGDNLIVNLANYQKEGQYSANHLSLEGTDYSIASIVTSLCGIPYRFSPKRDIWKSKFFLPQAVCMPEILKDNGYQTAFIKAADITFTDANLFLLQHGFDEAIGVDEIKKYYPKDGFEEKHIGSFGGVTDRTLFDFAKKKIDMFDDDKPFMLGLFSLDTHMPDYHLDESCEEKFGDLRDVFKCTDKAVYEFVEWFKTTKYYENTTILIMGDHLLPVRIEGQVNAKRGIYNVFLNLPSELKFDVNKKFALFDLAPSILESVGAKIKPRALGLGRTLFGDEVSLIEEIGERKLNIKIMQRSEVYEKFTTPKVERVSVYKSYNIGDEIDKNKILEYAEAFESVLGSYYIDRLNIKLEGYNGGDLEGELYIFAIMDSDSGIDIFANDVKVGSKKLEVLEKQPLVIKFDIKKELVKDGKIQLILNNTKPGFHAASMGVNVHKLVIKNKSAN